MIFLYIILGIVILVFVLLNLNINIILEYHNDFSAKIGILLFRFDASRAVSLFGPDKKNEEGKKKSKKKKSEPRKKKSFSDIKGFLRFVTDIIRKSAKELSDRLKIKLCYLDISVASEDASTTAIEYGLVSSLFCVLDDAASEFMHYRSNPDKIRIYPDYCATSSSGKIKIIFTIKPIHILSIGTKIFGSILKDGSQISKKAIPSNTERITKK